VVALQELDVGHARTECVDQPVLLAGLLRMHCYFHPAVEGKDQHYGDAILSRLPMRLVHAAPLPTRLDRPHLERRGALWVEVEFRGRHAQVLNTHLGLDPWERMAQVEALVGPNWLGRPDCRAPRLLCGDFNCWPGTRAYRRLRQALRNAQDRVGSGWPRATCPAIFPFLCIDHVFHGPEVAVTRVKVPRTRLTRVASDHLPLVVEVSLP
jgi:endonuclease/exonuclease/phosphatase family metal-dependent hydrolase